MSDRYIGERLTTAEIEGLIDPATGDIDADLLPAFVISNPYVVADQAARLALSANVGDVAIQTDTQVNYILAALPASTNGNWVALATPATATVTNGGAGNAGKHLALDAAGKAAGRVLETDGASLDAVVGAPVITTTATSAFSAETNLGALGSGVLKVTVALGVATPSIAVAGTDFEAAGTTQAHINDTTDAHLAGAIGYTPADSADWPNPDPDDVGEGLDKLADRTASLETQVAALPVGQGGTGGTTGGIASIEGVTNAGGNIDLIGDGITVTADNGVAKSITLAPSGTKPFGIPTSVISSPYTVLATDTWLECSSSASSIVLQAAPGTGRSLLVSNRHASNTMTTTGANVMGSASHGITPGTTRILVFNGTDYTIV